MLPEIRRQQRVPRSIRNRDHESGFSHSITGGSSGCPINDTVLVIAVTASDGKHFCPFVVFHPGDPREVFAGRGAETA